jgi:glyoxylase-like metal-dependent hydrolase (beta-lactamase superfamily II)
VVLDHPGRGHTDHDLTVHVPDAGVLFAGDLVEQGGPPDFTDAHPLDWPAAITRLLAPRPGTVVPGHGDPVDRSFVIAQQAELTALAQLCRAVQAGELDESEAVAASPYPRATTKTALSRATHP